jgi:hypothetical protein
MYNVRGQRYTYIANAAESYKPILLPNIPNKDNAGNYHTHEEDEGFFYFKYMHSGVINKKKGSSMAGIPFQREAIVITYRDSATISINASESCSVPWIVRNAIIGQPGVRGITGDLAWPKGKTKEKLSIVVHGTMNISIDDEMSPAHFITGLQPNNWYTIEFQLKDGSYNAGGIYSILFQTKP